MRTVTLSNQTTIYYNTYDAIKNSFTRITAKCARGPRAISTWHITCKITIISSNSSRLHTHHSVILYINSNILCNHWQIKSGCNVIQLISLLTYLLIYLFIYFIHRTISKLYFLHLNTSFNSIHKKINI